MGGPTDWDTRISELWVITGKPVLVNEWGFSSAGEAMTPEEQRQALAGTASCQFRKWMFTWGVGHNPESQAEYVRQVDE